METDTSRLTIATVREGFREVHAQIRKLIDGLDREALNWKPHPEANSIAILITHTLESEREMLAAVRGVKVPRDRPSEFTVESDLDHLVEMLEHADAWLTEQTGPMAASDLTADRPRGDRPPRRGVVWLVTNYGHAREHLAQMELTKQLYEGRG